MSWIVLLRKDGGWENEKGVYHVSLGILGGLSDRIIKKINRRVSNIFLSDL